MDASTENYYSKETANAILFRYNSKDCVPEKLSITKNLKAYEEEGSYPSIDY
jgi:hypothetical protein